MTVVPRADVGPDRGRAGAAKHGLEGGREFEKEGERESARAARGGILFRKRCKQKIKETKRKHCVLGGPPSIAVETELDERSRDRRRKT